MEKFLFLEVLVEGNKKMRVEVEELGIKLDIQIAYTSRNTHCDSRYTNSGKLY